MQPYIAPEMLEGREYLVRATDFWALGVMLFRLLMGELPFTVCPCSYWRTERYRAMH
jgi:serine/threonine protein kinase